MEVASEAERGRAFCGLASDPGSSGGCRALRALRASALAARRPAAPCPLLFFALSLASVAPRRAYFYQLNNPEQRLQQRAAA
eukprot:3469749-Alexandrium_andersonii.AAC.1